MQICVSLLRVVRYKNVSIVVFICNSLTLATVGIYEPSFPPVSDKNGADQQRRRLRILEETL